MTAIAAMIWMTVVVSAASIDNSAYKDIVFEIKDYVPVERCADILMDLEVSFSWIYIFFFVVIIEI